jgi:hypothetical protein
MIGILYSLKVIIGCETQFLSFLVYFRVDRSQLVNASLWVTSGTLKNLNNSRSIERVSGSPKQTVVNTMTLSSRNEAHRVYGTIRAHILRVVLYHRTGYFYELVGYVV